MNQRAVTTLLDRIVIARDGAGSFELASRLGKILGRRGKAEIILIGLTCMHLWKLLLHYVAAGTLDNHADEMEFPPLSTANSFQFMLRRTNGLNRVFLPRLKIW